MSTSTKNVKVAVFISNPKDTYSGGRYFGLMIAEVLAIANAEVYYVTNNLPIFWSDFEVFPNHNKVKVINGWKTALTKLPEDLDVIYLVPGTSNKDFYDSAIDCALNLQAHLTLVNFESENWFNQYAPTPKPASNWAQWRRVAKASTSIMSIADEGTKYAKDYYKDIPNNCRFFTCYPAINTYAADLSKGTKREKRILLLTRFNGDKHKGADKIVNVVSESMTGYTLTVLVGTGQVPNETKSELEERCKKFGITLDWQFKLSDIAKFDLYRRSSLLLFPSLFEGYGYPPIEARYCGCKVVAYDLPVLRETCGDDIFYAKHGDMEDFSKKVADALFSLKPVSGIKLNETAMLDAMQESLLGELNRVKKETINNKQLRHILTKSDAHFHATDRQEKSQKFLIELSRTLRARFKKNKGKVTFYPKFDDQKALTNHYYRSAWYLPFQENILEEVNMYLLNKLERPGSCPDYMTDSYSSDQINLKKGKFNYFIDLITADIVLLWKGELKEGWLTIIEALGIPIVNVDTNDVNAKEYGNYPGITWRYFLNKEQKTEVIQESYQTLANLVCESKLEGVNKAVVFGTGPSLENAHNYNFENAVTIACNSIVQDEDLMEHINPKVVCAGDAVSHFGISTYAETFRRDLLKQIKNRDLYYFGTATFGYLFKVHFPEYASRFLLIEQDLDGPNFDLVLNYSAPKLVSTMNIHMLPLASTFADDIYVLGCDGRIPKKDNEDFWAHSEKAQYHDLVDTGHICHPMFNIHRQQSMYDDYGISVQKTLSTGVAKYGKRYTSLKQSYVKAFTECCLTDQWYAQNNLSFDKKISLSEVDKLLPVMPDKKIPLLCDEDLETKISISFCQIESGLVHIKGYFLSPYQNARLCFEDESGNKFWLMKKLKRPDIAKKFDVYNQDMVGFDVKLDLIDESETVSILVVHESEIIKQIKAKINRGQ